MKKFAVILRTCNKSEPRVVFFSKNYNKLLTLLGQYLMVDLKNFQGNPDECGCFSDHGEIVAFFLCGTVRIGYYTPKSEDEVKFVNGWDTLYAAHNSCPRCSRYIYIVKVDANIPLTQITSDFDV